jgi:hypothetical protein
VHSLPVAFALSNATTDEREVLVDLVSMQRRSTGRGLVFAEDHQNAYLGAAAHGMALFRNLAIGLIRLAGHTQIKRTIEHLAADRTRILPLLAASRP